MFEGKNIVAIILKNDYIVVEKMIKNTSKIKQIKLKAKKKIYRGDSNGKNHCEVFS